MDTAEIGSMIENPAIPDEELLAVLKERFDPHHTAIPTNDTEFTAWWNLGKLGWQKRPHLMRAFNAWYTERSSKHEHIPGRT